MARGSKPSGSPGGRASPKASGPSSPICLRSASEVAAVTPSLTGSMSSNQRGIVASTHSARERPVARHAGAASVVCSSSHSVATATASATAWDAAASCTSLPSLASTCLRATSVARSREPVGDCWACMKVPSWARIAACVAGSVGSTPMLRIISASSGLLAASPSTCSSIAPRSPPPKPAGPPGPPMPANPPKPPRPGMSGRPPNGSDASSRLPPRSGRPKGESIGSRRVRSSPPPGHRRCHGRAGSGRGQTGRSSGLVAGLLVGLLVGALLALAAVGPAVVRHVSSSPLTRCVVVLPPRQPRIAAVGSPGSRLARAGRGRDRSVTIASSASPPGGIRCSS